MPVVVKTLGDLIAGREPLKVDAGASVLNAARVMAERSKGAVLVTKADRLGGIFTERDLMTRVVARELDPARTRVGDVMTTKLTVARPDESYQSGLSKMSATNCRHLPVVDGDRVVGLVSRRELMALDIRAMEELMDKTEPSSLFI